MYKCEICGRKIKKKIALRGYILCSKHMHQLYKHGKFLDNISRTNNDLNDYKIYGNITIFNLYNQKNILIGQFIIDTEDIERIKYHKWRMSHGHVVTGLPAKHNQRDLSWVVLKLDKNSSISNKVVDHINGNPLDNRKINLRICSQGQNILNKSFMSNNTSGFIGVSYKKDKDRYDPEIRINGKRCHLGYTKNIIEAVYARLYAEKIVFQKYANKKECMKKEKFSHNLPQEKKQKIEERVKLKLSEKGIWQSVI